MPNNLKLVFKDRPSNADIGESITSAELRFIGKKKRTLTFMVGVENLREPVEVVMRTPKKLLAAWNSAEVQAALVEGARKALEVYDA